MLLSPSKINKHLGKNSGVKGWLYAIAGGIFISGPPYKIYFLPAIIYYFNLRYAVILSIYIILFSILNGILLEFIISENE
jgi:hypothetical protein